MKVIVSNSTYGMGSNPHGGATKTLQLTQQECEYLVNAGYGVRHNEHETRVPVAITGPEAFKSWKTVVKPAEYSICGLFFKHTIWNKDTPPYWEVVVNQRLVRHLGGYPTDGGPNKEGMAAIAAIEQAIQAINNQ